jgi:hypothetical protein
MEWEDAADREAGEAAHRRDGRLDLVEESRTIGRFPARIALGMNRHLRLAIHMADREPAPYLG